MVEIRRCNLRQELRQFDYRWRGRLKKGVVVRQSFHLFPGRINQFLTSITHIDAPQAGHRIQVSISIAVPKKDPVRPGDDAASFFRQFFMVGKGMEIVFGIQIL